jgi:hypothetical protein
VKSHHTNKFLLYLYDVTSRQRYDSLVDFINDRLAQFYHLSNLAIVTVQDDEVYERIENLSKCVTFLGLQVCTIATNAANFVSFHNNKMDYALNKTNNEQEKAEWFSRAIKDKQDIEERTIATVKQLTEEERVSEVARMMSDGVLTPEAISLATQLLTPKK